MKNSGNTHVFVVDDHVAARESMTDVLRSLGHIVTCCASAQEALTRLENDVPDVVITDLQMPGMCGTELIREMDHRRIDAQIIMVTAHASVESAVEAMRYGAYDYIEKPFNAEQLESVVNRAIAHAGQGDRRSVHPKWSGNETPMIGSSSAMMQLQREIDRCAQTNVTVLITGESGTGKELVAQQLHLRSHRAGQPIVSVNCPAMSPQLMESELFGHQQGAFTGAESPRIGRFELAEGGTILLDEVTEIDASLQAKLLRVLQERCFERVGSSHTQPIDVRVLATTNRNLADEVAAGRFREDLYFRLAVVPLQVPPLRHRAEDIPLLAEHFLHAAAARAGTTPTPLQDCALQLLTDYRWPGNVRELENLMTRASVLCGEDSISAATLRPWLLADPESARNAPATAVGTSLQEMERALIEATLEHYDGHRAQTARALGIGIRTLSNKLRAYGYAPRANFAKSA